MIFKYQLKNYISGSQPQEPKDSSGRLSKLDLFSFKDLDDEKMLYEGHGDILIKKIESENSKKFLPDIVASLLQNIYSHGFLTPYAISQALATCYDYILARGDFEFLGTIDKQDNSLKYHKAIVEKNGFFEGNITSDNILDLFQPGDFKNSKNIFFVPGCQTINMLNRRINMASYLVSQLNNKGELDENNTNVILSGKNNAKKEGNDRVKFSNESSVMQNLMIKKLAHYLKGNERFYTNIVEKESESLDTKDNLSNLMAMLKDKLDAQENNKKLNIFIISSTFHILQLRNEMMKHLSNEKTLALIKKKEIDLYYVGAENPWQEFHTLDDRYIKLLFNWVIDEEFKFLKEIRDVYSPQKA